MTSYPRIHLAIDNCFASKRWTTPRAWMQHALDFGIPQIEASADTECDPLYTPPDALRDWLDAVKTAASQTGAKVANFYSGHSSYATLGLAHPDARVRDHMQHRWLGGMIDMASALGAGLGFFCHALDQSILADADRYKAAMNDLYTRLGQLAVRARDAKLPYISVEQMYSPHQPPWTIAGSCTLLREAWQRSGAPMYLTIDVGHAVGQRSFLRSASASAIDDGRELYAQPKDGDPYAWLSALGAYSPIIHLQQTDGTASAHRPFISKFNATGIITPERVLRALKDAYDAPLASDDLPPTVDDIWLTIEVFSGTAQPYDDILANLRETAAYWRAALPRDGERLDAWI
jgi:D-erythrulose 1-phosphate 3-epimerase